MSHVTVIGDALPDVTLFPGIVTTSYSVTANAPLVGGVNETSARASHATADTHVGA